MQNQIEQLNLKQEKLVLDERNKTNRKLSLNKLKRYLENGEIITEFDKDAFEILVKQVIIGGYDEKDKADPKQVTFVLKMRVKQIMKIIYRQATILVKKSTDEQPHKWTY